MANEVTKVVLFCLLWYLVSSSNNVIGKTLLNEFPYPMTVTMFQLLSITIYSGPIFNVWHIRKFVDMSWSYYAKIIVPLALGKFMISVLTHISIWKVPVSYAHTVKATMPLFSVILSRIVLHEKQTTKVYISLIPIIVGVGIATMTELSFDMLGLICALVATVQLSMQNIFSKKVLQDTGVHHLRLLHVLGRLSFFLFLPIWIYFDLSLITEEISFFSNGRYQVFALLLIDGLLNWMQNILAFTVMSMVTSLTFAVANASKRIFIIVGSLLVMGNPVTIVNVFGMMLAILGVLLYNKAKYDAKQEDIKKTVLPFSMGNKNSFGNGITNLRYTKLHNKLLNGFMTNNNYRNKMNEISPV